MSFVTAPTNKFIMHFKDDAGKPASVQVFVDSSETDPAAGGPAALAAAAQSCSNDALISQELLITGVNLSPGTPTDGPYSRGADKAKFVLRTADGTPVTLMIGAPQETDFGTGAVLIDPTDTNVAALIAALIANACTPSGDAIVGFQRGYRMRPPRRKHQ